jgi:hypothetical protein
MLFKPHYLGQFIEGFSPAVLECSRNMAKGVLLIHGVIADRFYDQSIAGCIDAVSENLSATDFHQRLETFHSTTYHRNLSDNESFEKFSTRCFDYYFSRLPILFRKSRIVRNRRKLRLSEAEIEKIEHGCIAEWTRHHNSVVREYRFTGERLTSLSLTKWYTNRVRRDSHVYDSSWLAPALATNYPKALTDSNIENVAVYAIESCFPMFWDHLQGRYRYSLSMYGTLGWFAGEPDYSKLSQKS